MDRTVEDSWESRADTSLMHALSRIVRSLPTTWLRRRQAERLLPTLANYRGDVSVPDGEIIYQWIEELCETPHRRPGSPEGHRAEDWLVEKLGALGLEDVVKEPMPIHWWKPEGSSLAVANCEVPCFPIANTAFSNSVVEAPLVYVGSGTARDYNRVDVEGKIVVADVRFPTLPMGLLLRILRAAYAVSDPSHELGLGSTQLLSFVRQNFIGGACEATARDDTYWRAQRGGARGIVLVLKDQRGNTASHFGPYDGIMKPLPGVWVGRSDGSKLVAFAKAGRTATLTSNGLIEDGTMHNVWGVLPGQSDEVILVTSHHDSPHKGAVEDGAGVAQVLAQVWAWSRLPLSQRPKTLIFVLDAGHFYGSRGAHVFARQHPEIMSRTKILITLEHLGAKEVVESSGALADSGKLAFSAMFTTPDPKVIAPVIKSLRAEAPRATASIPSTFFGPAPTSDAMGYVLEANVPVVSWIACPTYLLDEDDTLDKVSKSSLHPIGKTVTELLKNFMAN